MNVLVTGGAGYIGSHTAHLLHDQGHRVIVVDDLSRGNKKLLPPGVPLFVFDCADQSAISTLLDTYEISTIIHFAGSVVVPESVTNPLHYYNNNTSKTRSFLEIAIRSGVKNIVFSSTAAVYGTPGTVPVTEESEPKPLSPYGYSKLMSEKMIEHASFAHDLKFVILRYFNVAGSDPLGRTGLSSPNATHIFKVCVEAALGRRPAVQVYGSDYPTHDGTGIRDYIHVSDLASAHASALHYLADGGDSAIVNCGYGRGYSVLEVVEAVKQASGVDFVVEFGPRRPGDMAEIFADISKLTRLLKWRPQFDDLSKIASDALRWEACLATGRQGR